MIWSLQHGIGVAIAHAVRGPAGAARQIPRWIIAITVNQGSSAKFIYFDF